MSGIIFPHNGLIKKKSAGGPSTRDDVVALFGVSDKGLFYDGSDLSTMTVNTDGSGGAPADLDRPSGGR